jgi:predicted nucleotidyltransferase
MSLARLYPVSSSELMPQVLAFVAEARLLKGIEKIIVFGSLAREEMTSASDIDIAVLLESTEHLKYLKEKLLEVKRKTLRWPCDLMVCDLAWYENRKDFGGVCVAIAAEGKILFDRTSEENKS